MTRHLWLIGWCFCLLGLHAAEVMPPAPKAYFNDYAGVVPVGDASALNRQLEDFEKATSNQVVVAVFPKMESDSSIEDYTARVAQKWGVGQKGKNNGVVLFVFIQDRKMFIQVGYGLEGALPDATAKLIIENEIKPHFKQGDYAGGLRAGINAILAATKGEYKGKGETVAQSTATNSYSGTDYWNSIFFPIFFLVFFYYWIVGIKSNFSSTVYSSRGMNYWGGGWGGGGGSSGGGFSGGGFSGGGGSFGGGGAGGSW